MAESEQLDAIDYEAHPGRYPVDMDDEQVLQVAPYAARLLPYWRYASADDAARSAAALYEWYTRFKEAGDFVGMDVARRLLRLGLKRTRGLEPPAVGAVGAPMRPTATAIFSKTFHMVNNDPDFAAMRDAHAERSRGD
jgi:hypothetical protein